jgi:hypothetical protein
MKGAIDMATRATLVPALIAVALNGPALADDRHRVLADYHNACAARPAMSEVEAPFRANVTLRPREPRTLICPRPARRCSLAIAMLTR